MQPQKIHPRKSLLRPACVINNEGSCWPTLQQELLLRAALLDKKYAIDAWHKWKSNVDIDRLDAGSLRLLPLLYRNLRLLGVKDPLLNTFKGVHRRTWYENQILFRNMSNLLCSFHDAGIQTMILKGAALAILHYRDYGLRFMSDFDILIPTEQTFIAIDLLTKQGWKPKFRTLEAFFEPLFNVRHAETFKDGGGNECDLHWHLLYECCYEHADDAFWDDAKPVELHDVTTHALSPTDQLFHVCVHGAMWNIIPPVRWVADAMMIFNTSASDIDWNRLVALAKERCVILQVEDTLSYLDELLDAPIPSDVLQSMKDVTVSRIEGMEYRAKTRPSRFGELLHHWFRYKCLLKRRRNAGLATRSIGFARFLQHTWKVSHVWKLPFCFISKSVRRSIRILSNTSLKV